MDPVIIIIWAVTLQLKSMRCSITLLALHLCIIKLQNDDRGTTMMMRLHYSQPFRNLLRLHHNHWGPWKIFWQKTWRRTISKTHQLVPKNSDKKKSTHLLRSVWLYLSKLTSGTFQYIWPYRIGMQKHLHSCMKWWKRVKQREKNYHESRKKRPPTPCRCLWSRPSSWFPSCSLARALAISYITCWKEW